MTLKIDCITSRVERHPRLDVYLLIKSVYVTGRRKFYNRSWQMVDRQMLDSAQLAGTVYRFPLREESWA